MLFLIPHVVGEKGNRTSVAYKDQERGKKGKKACEALGFLFCLYVLFETSESYSFEQILLLCMDCHFVRTKIQGGWVIPLGGNDPLAIVLFS